LSGIVGILRRDSALVERSLLSSLTNFLRFRGPDAQEVWANGAMGLGHTMLRTTREAAAERQPVGLGRDLWITADVRLDRRAELIEKLARADCRFDAASITDPELILHAYATWREACVDHLRGDFAFALWDAAEKKLFCARDHFGIKPFFYSVSGQQFVFSNTLNCLRAHPDISDELNEAAIGDFLLFGLNCEIATTTFRNIQRLPPAHFMVVTADGLRTKRYWSPPIDGRIRYRRPEEYVEHFREILKSAVADRLRTDRVGIFLSGGLDSGSVAAMARELSGSAAGARELQAYTIFFESFLDEEERVYAKITADHLRIPIQFLPADTSELRRRPDDDRVTSPEPAENPLLSDALKTFRLIGADCRVAFSGEGADNLMDFQMWPYAKDLMRRREWRALAADMARFLWMRPFPWRGLAYRGKKLFGVDSSKPAFPKWVNGEFCTRMNLADRWRTFRFTGPEVHPVLPRAHASLEMPQWNELFENADAGWTGSPLEIRYPFLDLRVVDYLLSLPPFPWFFNKQLLRRAMEPLLPKATLRRAKTPLLANPVAEALRGQTGWPESVEFCDAMEPYVTLSQLFAPPRAASANEMDVMIRPICLNFWLQSYERVRYKLKVEVHNA
jgi:asparagine synthase (glutamine-hydrolysing)